MTAEERRKSILEELCRVSGQVSATSLASKYGVSRQVIVGDIALLRAAGEEIYSTPRGYTVKRESGGIIRTLACIHTRDGMKDELNIMVDNGCQVLDVVVEHPVYGELRGQLMLSNRFDVSEFVQRSERMNASPLSALTGGLHLHTLRFEDERAYNRVVSALAEAGYLYTDKDC